MDAFLLAPILSSLLETVTVAIRELAVKASVVEELRCVKVELETLESYLKDVSEKRDTNQRIRDYVRDVAETLYDIEDDVELMIVCGSQKSKIERIWVAFDECFGSRVGDKMNATHGKIRAFSKNLELLGVKKASAVEGVNFSSLQDSEQPYGSRDISVGLEDEVEILVHNVFDEKPEPGRICPAISIYGMGGIGKTTLARRVYNDPQVRRKFEGFAWAKVGHNFQTRKVLEDIFLQLVKESDEQQILTFSNIELVMRLYEIQLSKKYLIVLDDVWDKDAWKCLKLAFPSQDSASKIIVTTQSRKLAEEISGKGITHKPRWLTKDESWKLFMENAFPGGHPGKFASKNLLNQSAGKNAFSGGAPGMFSSNHLANQAVDILLNGAMHKIAMGLVDKCSGLPVALVFLGKLLGRKHTLDHWKLVQQRIDRIASTELESEETKIPRVLALTNYFDVPYYLKPCFLYLGLFPEDSQIKSEILFRLWIAEGLILPTSEKSQIKIDIAECYLNELINRNMVQVQEEKAPTSTWPKIIRLHKLIRDLSVLKGKEENFTEVMDVGTPNQLKYFDHKTRRLALYFYKNEDGNLITFKKEKLHLLRSLLLFNSNQHSKDITLPPDISNLKHSKFLRILHFDGFKFETGNSLNAIGELTILRYLSFNQCTLDELPSSIGNLIHLETLDLRVETSTRIYIPNVLSRIVSLRHLYLPLQFWVHSNEKLRLDSLKNLETLQNFDASLCNSKDIIKLPKLCHLEVTTSENLDDLETIANNLRTTSKGLCHSSFSIKSSNCYSERRLSILAKLFEFPTLCNLRIEGHMGNLPEMISSSLTRLVLSRAELVEDPMAALEKFPRLWMLDLNNDAYLGKQMVCSASGFPKLKLLKLSTLHNLESICIEKGAMPNL